MGENTTKRIYKPAGPLIVMPIQVGKLKLIISDLKAMHFIVILASFEFYSAKTSINYARNKVTMNIYVTIPKYQILIFFTRGCRLYIIKMVGGAFAHRGQPA